MSGSVSVPVCLYPEELLSAYRTFNGQFLSKYWLGGRVPKRGDDEPQQSMEPCFHFSCSKLGERYVFLGLKTMHVVRVCSDCHDDVYDLSNLLYDLCMEITTFGIPNPLSTWRIGDSYQITNLSTLKLLMRYLRDTLLILEVKISTRWPAYTKIVKVVENLTLNIANIGEQEEIENS